MKYLVLISTLLAPLAALADENIPDQYPASILYSKPVEYIPGVFSAIGASGPPPMKTQAITTI